MTMKRKIMLPARAPRTPIAMVLTRSVSIRMRRVAISPAAAPTMKRASIAMLSLSQT
jgi:hypothetical protein